MAFMRPSRRAEIILDATSDAQHGLNVVAVPEHVADMQEGLHGRTVVALDETEAAIWKPKL